MTKSKVILHLVVCSLLLSGCNQDANEQTHKAKSFDLSDFQTEKSTKVSQSAYITSSISDSYNHACPRLLQKEVDSSIITRTKEHMKGGQYCDYYIYPSKGESLEITSHNSNIEVVLIMPKFYDFANGPYPIETNRRHVIRVKYNGIDIMPDDFVYDIDFNLN